MLTAITHTKPNRKLSGFAMPGIEVRKGSSGGSNGTGKPSGGFSLGDDTSDDDLKNDLRNGGHDFDDDDDGTSPRFPNPSDCLADCPE